MDDEETRYAGRASECRGVVDDFLDCQYVYDDRIFN